MKKLTTTLCLAALAMSGTVNGQGIETTSSFAPRVTSSYIPRGVDFALGRITTKGKNIVQEGFCYSDTNPLPSIEDSVTYDNTWTHNGTIYRIEGLKPTTIYYIRAYAINDKGEVGYSPVQKICTLKESNATFTYNNGGSEAENKRIYDATEEAIRYYHKATNFKDYDVNVTYNAGVPTADCSYGGTIRVGSNASYQATGTLLHEMNHGVGVGQHSRWMNDANLRSGTTTGNWLGVRANKVVQFFDNNETAVMKGDNQHMWPYGINGAHEDTHSEILYTANVMITQALAEDGLPPTYSMANGAPSMVFDAITGIKYYIKSECPGLGFEHGFLADENKKIVWKEKTADEITSDDHFAWHITFDPVSSRYSFQNVATGNYIAKEFVQNEANPWGTDILSLVEREEVGETEMLQLLGSRKDVTVKSDKGTFAKQSYWMFYPREGYWGYDPTLQAEEGGATQSTTYFEFGNRNTNQRWLYLTADEAKKFETVTGAGSASGINSIITSCKNLLATPHTDTTGNADSLLISVISTVEQYVAEPEKALNEEGEQISVDEITQMLYDAIIAFLPNVEVHDMEQPFDLTFLIENADLAENTDGWEESPTYAAGVCEYCYDKIAFSQKLPVKLPIGTFALHVKGFQRPGALETFEATQTNTNVSLGTKNIKIANIIDCAQDAPLHSTDIEVNGKYIPNTMAGAAEYFKAGLYDNVVYLTQDRASSIRINVGVKSTMARSDYWTCFKNFKLEYFGSQNPIGIQDIEIANKPSRTNNNKGIYSLSGLLISRDTEAINQLPKGIYIINGRKIAK